MRNALDAAFKDVDLDTDDPRLILASDMISDAAMEVTVLRSPKRSMTKTVDLDEGVSIPLGETGVVKALWKFQEGGQVFSPHPSVGIPLLPFPL